MSVLAPAQISGAAIGLDHVGIVGADLDALARSFTDLGFYLTPRVAHASGRTANRCVMLRDGGYLELMAVVPGQVSATLDRFLARGPGAHILALEVADEVAARDRLRRAGVACEIETTQRDAVRSGVKARFALLMPPDPPEGRVLLIRQLTRDRLWLPDAVSHPNRAVRLIEAVYATDHPAETMTRLSRLAGRPAEPDPVGGFRIEFGGGGCVRVLPPAAAATLFSGLPTEDTRTIGPPLRGLTIAAEQAEARVIYAGGVAIRVTAAAEP